MKWDFDFVRDYVTGFHKRKKKRRKEAIKQQEVKLRHKRIAARKQVLKRIPIDCSLFFMIAS